MAVCNHLMREKKEAPKSAATVGSDAIQGLLSDVGELQERSEEVIGNNPWMLDNIDRAGRLVDAIVRAIDEREG